jgi:ATP-dependent DNA helicase RecG
VANVDEPIAKVVGGTTAKALATGLDLHTVGDLVRHYPRRYAERGELTDLTDLTVGEHVTVLAEIEKVEKRPMRYRKGKLFEIWVTDGRGRLKLTFFRQAWREGDMRPGRRGLFAGKVGVFKSVRQLAHPEFVLFDDEVDDAAVEQFAGALIPVYPATKSIPSWNIARAVGAALDTLGEVEDPLPPLLRRRYGLIGLGDALAKIHRPESRADVREARARLRWDEAFILQVALAQRRAAAREQPATPRTPKPAGLLAAFDAQLPFALTAGQREVGKVIAADLAREHPMHRLLQGEVGSGKTVCALRAMLAVVDSGGQAALLAPTEVLAQQHHRSISVLLGPLGQAGRLGAADEATRVALLTGSQGAAARREALLDATSGDAGIVIGTHALLEDPVRFFDLGLVVVDEQHRFGVEQRDTLRGKGDKPPHLLVMTATPIPRTVAMTVFGDLEVSTLTELPAGRSPIATHAVPALEKPQYLDRAWQRLREEVAAGHQAYIVCPRIGDAEGAEEGAGSEGEPPDEPVDESAPPRRPPLAVHDVAPLLMEGPLHGLRCEVLHGRLPADTKDDVMRRFATGGVDVLIATTVVEVGVDVANATVMVVMDAERFGVSQLHQLRGRVGRGGAPGLCLLVTEAPPGSRSRERLDAVAATTDGFELSRIDLEQRREGDVLGASQSGRRSSLRLLAVLRDEELIRTARDEATLLVDADPQLERHPEVAAALRSLLDEDRAEYLEKA